MAKHHPDLIMCRKQPGVGESFFSCRIVVFLLLFSAIFFPPPPAIGRLCEKCELLQDMHARVHLP